MLRQCLLALAAHQTKSGFFDPPEETETTQSDTIVFRENPDIRYPEFRLESRQPSILVQPVVMETSTLRTISTEMPENVNFSDCSDIHFRTLAQPELPRTILTSFPGSGNTWLRHLIHMATGYYTGSVYHDGKLRDQGFKGEVLEWNDTRTVGIKMHTIGVAKKMALDDGRRLKEAFPRALLIVRSPYRVLLSEFNRISNKGHSHTGQADPEMFKNGTFRTFIDTQIPRWEKSIHKWITEYNGILKTVCFERMKEHTLAVVQEVSNFLGVPIARPQCVQRQSTGRFKRELPSNASSVVDRFYRENKLLDDRVALAARRVGEWLQNARLEDCTQYF